MITNLIDHLTDAGYEPDDDAPGHTVSADLVASGIGSIRVIIDGADVTIHAFDAFMACRWTTQFASVPDPIVIAALESAERELADLRGGPVTPAQITAAR